MNKEDVLKKAQEENKGKDIAGLEVLHRGARFAYIIGAFLLIAVDIVERIVLHRISYGCNMAMFAMLFTVFFTKFRNSRKKQDLFCAIALGITTACFAAAWIIQLCR